MPSVPPAYPASLTCPTHPALPQYFPACFSLSTSVSFFHQSWSGGLWNRSPRSEDQVTPVIGITAPSSATGLGSNTHQAESNEIGPTPPARNIPYRTQGGPAVHTAPIGSRLPMEWANTRPTHRPHTSHTAHTSPTHRPHRPHTAHTSHTPPTHRPHTAHTPPTPPTPHTHCPHTAHTSPTHHPHTTHTPPTHPGPPADERSSPFSGVGSLPGPRILLRHDCSCRFATRATSWRETRSAGSPSSREASIRRHC